MTYRRDSDIYHPYGLIIQEVNHNGNNGNNNESTTKELYLTKSKITELINKPKLATWLVSHCNTNTTSKRESFVHEIQEFIPIDIYGVCGNSTDSICKTRTEYCKTEGCSYQYFSDCYTKLAQTYKFYFAFENSLCVDYTTEKFFDALSNDIIPIVYGGTNNSRLNLASIVPKKSFIDTRDFSTTKELTNYLKYLDTNFIEYLEYFKWKNLYKVTKSNGWCDLCVKLNATANNRQHQVYNDIFKWWNEFPSGDDANANNTNMPACELPRNFSKIGWKDTSKNKKWK